MAAQPTCRLRDIYDRADRACIITAAEFALGVGPDEIAVRRTA